MIGDKRLEMPETTLEASIISYNTFGFKGVDTTNLYLAKRLVELNNEVHDNKLKEIKQNLEPLYCGGDDE